MRLIDADEFIKRVPMSACALETVPTVDAEPVKHGHWVKSKDVYHRCSVCESKRSAIEARYCHYCGAKMDEEVAND